MEKKTVNWQKLDKNALEKLKQSNSYILLYSDTYKQFPYDVINLLDLSDCGLSEEEMKYHWNSLHNANNKYEYDDDDLLDCYSHFCIISPPNCQEDN